MWGTISQFESKKFLTRGLKKKKGMKFNFQFSNLLGTVYRNGNLLYSPDGSSVFSPVGNKITIYDLQNHESQTLPIETRTNITTLALSPDGISLMAADEKGEIYFISLISKSILHSLRTERRISVIAFSPDSKHFAFTKENNVFVYKAPGNKTREYNPFILERVLKGAFDETTCIAWSSCSRVIAVGSRDCSTRIYFPKGNSYAIGGNTEGIIGVFFEEDDSLFCYTLSRNGHLNIWENSIDINQIFQEVPKKDDIDVEDDVKDEDKEVVECKDEKKFYYKRVARHFLRDLLEDNNRIELTSGDYHGGTKILVTGFSNGTFLIHEMPDVNLIHSLSISNHEITGLKLNSTGDWIAFGCAKQGQLLVWEWRSETFILKQQGHYNNLATAVYNHEGSIIATGDAQDGKVKLWNTDSGFCYVTFDEHTASVTSLAFSNNDKVLVSSSLDGSVRAFDMARYRNFRTFASPRPAQFSCVALDSSGDLVTAGAHDLYEIYLWSMQTGKLLEVIGGHEGPVTSLTFSPNLTSSTLVSVSWDKTLRIWNCLSAGSANEAIQLGSDGVAIAFKPDGDEVAVATLNGQISFFDIKTSVQIGSIDGRNDLGSGRCETDLITAKKTLASKSFNSICYSPDGSCILAGGTSKNICIYKVAEKILIKKFEITQNRSFDAMDDVFSRKKMSEFGNLGLVEDRDDEDANAIRLPGSKINDKSSRTLRPEVNVSEVVFAATGREFAVASTEGLLIYSLDNNLLFDPIDLTLQVTPKAVMTHINKGEFGMALVMALKLNETNLTRRVIESIDNVTEIDLIIQSIHDKYIDKVIRFLGNELQDTKHLQFYVIWAQKILEHHGVTIKKKSKELTPSLNLLQKNLMVKSKDLGDICNHNMYTIRFLLAMSKLKKEQITSDSEEDDHDDNLLMEIEQDETFVSNWSDD